MSTTRHQVPSTYFETQRAALLGEIAHSLEHVLQNINKLNRSLEGVIAVRISVLPRSYSFIASLFPTGSIVNQNLLPHT